MPALGTAARYVSDPTAPSLGILAVSSFRKCRTPGRLDPEPSAPVIMQPRARPSLPRPAVSNRSMDPGWQCRDGLSRLWGEPLLFDNSRLRLLSPSLPPEVLMSPVLGWEESRGRVLGLRPRAARDRQKLGSPGGSLFISAASDSFVIWFSSFSKESSSSSKLVLGTVSWPLSLTVGRYDGLVLILVFDKRLLEMTFSPGKMSQVTDELTGVWLACLLTADVWLSPEIWLELSELRFQLIDHSELVALPACVKLETGSKFWEYSWCRMFPQLLGSGRRRPSVLETRRRSGSCKGLDFSKPRSSPTLLLDSPLHWCFSFSAEEEFSTSALTFCSSLAARALSGDVGSLSPEGALGDKVGSLPPEDPPVSG